MDFNGEDFGDRTTTKTILAFNRAVSIKNLSSMPLELHPQVDRIKTILIQRGARFEQYADMHFAHYSGIAMTPSSARTGLVNTDGRIVIDCKTFHRLNANDAFTVQSLSNRKSRKNGRTKDVGMVRYGRSMGPLLTSDEEEDVAAGDMGLVPDRDLDLQPLTDEQRMLANASMRGFSFAEKQWLDFFIDQTSAIQWNEESFDQLVLSELQKNLVKALVSEHTQKETTLRRHYQGQRQRPCACSPWTSWCGQNADSRVRSQIHQKTSVCHL